VLHRSVECTSLLRGEFVALVTGFVSRLGPVFCESKQFQSANLFDFGCECVGELPDVFVPRGNNPSDVLAALLSGFEEQPLTEMCKREMWDRRTDLRPIPHAINHE